MQRAIKREANDRAIQDRFTSKVQTLIKPAILKPLLGTEHLFIVEALSPHKSSLTLRIKKKGGVKFARQNMKVRESYLSR